MVAQYIATRSLMDFYEAAERKQVGDMRWWEQAGIDLKGARETAVATTEAEKDGT